MIVENVEVEPPVLFPPGPGLPEPPAPTVTGYVCAETGKPVAAANGEPVKQSDVETPSL